MLNFDDPRSKLFFDFVRLLDQVRKTNPNVNFMLENVKMKKEYRRIITEYLGVWPVKIDSNLVSAQNRERWYWSNIKTKTEGLFAEVHTDIPQPEDRKIYLKDVLQPESEVDEKYYVSGKFLKRIMEYDRTRVLNMDDPKTGTLMANQSKQSSDQLVVDVGCLKFGRTDEAKQIRREAMKNGKDYTPFQGKQITGVDPLKMNTITCATQKDNLICVAIRGRHDGFKNEQMIEPRYDGKTNCLTTVQKDNMVLTSTKIRRLTPIECSRLQTIPEWYVWKCSDTQCYQMLGNGWTNEVIKHIFSFIKK